MAARILVAWLPSSSGHACFSVRVDNPSITLDSLYHTLPEFTGLTFPPSYAFLLFANSATPSLYQTGSLTVAEAISIANNAFPNSLWCIHIIGTLADSPYGFPQALTVNTASIY